MKLAGGLDGDGGLYGDGGLDGDGGRRIRERWRALAGSIAGSMVLAASTAAGSIDNVVGGRVTIDGDGGRRWRWLGR